MKLSDRAAYWHRAWGSWPSLNNAQVAAHRCCLQAACKQNPLELCQTLGMK